LEHASSFRCRYSSGSNRSRLRDGFVHHDRANAGKIEATQEAVGSELSGLGELNQKLRDHGAQLAHLAGELVNRRQTLRRAFARQILEALLRKGINELIEAAADAVVFFFEKQPRR